MLRNKRLKVANSLAEKRKTSICTRDLVVVVKLTFSLRNPTFALTVVIWWVNERRWSEILYKLCENGGHVKERSCGHSTTSNTLKWM